MATISPPAVVIPPQEAEGLTWAGDVPVTNGYVWYTPPVGRATLSRDEGGAIRADIRWREEFVYDEKYHEFGYSKAGDRIVELTVLPKFEKTEEADRG
jgi:hypothetical protein